GRHDSGAHCGLLSRTGRCAGDRPRRRARRGTRSALRDRDADGRSRVLPPAGGGSARGRRVRIAVVGGTGSFGRALARRLAEADYEVVIGSRDAERAAEIAAELGVEGATNADACRSADLVALATKAEAAVDTARQLHDAIGATP